MSHSFSKITFSALVVAALIGGAVMWNMQSGSKSKTPPRNQALPVTVAQAQVKPMPRLLEAVGRVQPYALVNVRSRIDGEIARVEVRDGQDVKTDDVLFVLDTRQLQAALQQAEANRDRDRAQLENAKREVDRLTPLAQRGIASKAQFDKVRSDAASLEATVKASEAAIQNIRVQLTYATIRATIDGRVGSIPTKVGNSIKANDSTPLASIVQLQPIYVVFAVPQTNLIDLQKGLKAGKMKARAFLPGQPPVVEEGEVAFIENTMDVASNTLQVKATFPNVSGYLWPGQFIKVEVTLSVDPQAITIPSVAVQAGQNGSFVFVVNQDTVEPRVVTVDRVVGREAVITQGLNLNETVVVDGQLRLTAGSRVTVVKEGNAAPVAIPGAGADEKPVPSKPAG